MIAAVSVRRRGDPSALESREREWHEYLERRVAEASDAVYSALLELDG